MIDLDKTLVTPSISQKSALNEFARGSTPESSPGEESGAGENLTCARRDGAGSVSSTDPLAGRGEDVKCRICGASSGTVHEVREMMFGFRESFRYFACDHCGCLHLVEPPSDMSRYYPRDEYYSFNQSMSSDWQKARPGWLRRRKNEFRLFGGPRLRRLFPRLFSNQLIEDLLFYIGELKRKSLGARILDVGCGGGWLLNDLARVGFRNLTGVDPYLDAGIVPPPGVKLVASTVDRLDGDQFDYIMFNHSLEHMDNPVETLSQAGRLLGRGGVCRVEVPVADCQAWREYGADWIEIDAPRHYFLHTSMSMRLVADQAGLEIYREDRVGTAMEFWGSELYRRDIPYFDPETRRYREASSVFGADQVEEFKRKSAVANEEGVGGRVAFYLRPSRAARRGRDA